MSFAGSVNGMMTNGEYKEKSKTKHWYVLVDNDQTVLPDLYSFTNYRDAEDLAFRKIGRIREAWIRTGL